MTEQGAVQPFVTDNAEDVIDYFTILYQEYFSVNATDRCGNTVILDYKGEFKTGE